MSIPRKLIRNAKAILTNPAMASAYAGWLAGRLRGSTTVTTSFGARLSGFENFSNYWGTICKIPSAEQFEFVASFLKTGSAVCFDIGANIGSFAVILGKRLPDCLIHAFEPAPNTFSILQSNVRLNCLSNVHAHQLAIAGKDGTVRFSNDPRISQRNHIVSAAEAAIASCDVPAVALDSFCETHRIERIGFVKVDCEGVEPLVLRGARGLLAQQRIGAMLVEVCPRNLRDFEFSIDDLLAAADGLPYAFHRFNDGGGVGERVTAREMGAFHSEDVLFLPC